MSYSFWEAVKGRRSRYGFSSEKPVSEERITQIVRDAIYYTPSAFNSQSTRIVILFHDNNRKLWDFTLEELKKYTTEEQFEDTKTKVNQGLASGYGTILFFEDHDVVKGLMDNFPLYKDNFPVWSQHTSAMHQFVVWTALEAEGLGASLQHYNPLIDSAVAKEWEIPDNWKLVAQMPFGKPLADPGEKTFSEVDARIKVFK
ncbi:nitroreductase family protein [Anaerocolumna sp. AGMB13025]|uniref:nitroreductase family protein n=1 Tax=Anaerocolumna sp. AGMB13025 TaxID=3039116 RepID=UPI00241F01AB|nr:nitroreductase family protein [Anaerocolumna sp. AGMB13025]WFR56645.1 nitroreductase family protein [Anaerocolumna sp. AGMB13025]